MANSAMWKYTITNSKYLYVGKVKKIVSGRMVIHLEYSKNLYTSGLQLFDWSKGMNLKLKLCLMEFIPEMADLMGIIELKVKAEDSIELFGHYRKLFENIPEPEQYVFRNRLIGDYLSKVNFMISNFVKIFYNISSLD